MSVSVIEKESKILLRVMSREYAMQCPEGKFKALFQSASHLDEKIREMITHKAMAVDQLVVVSALHTIYELLVKLQKKEHHIEQINQRLSKISTRLASVLGE